MARHRPQRLEDSHSQLSCFPPLRGAKGSLRGAALREWVLEHLRSKKAKLGQLIGFAQLSWLFNM